MAAILDNLTGSTNIILKGDHQRGIWPKFGFIPSSVKFFLSSVLIHTKGIKLFLSLMV
jgi:hypothetical protein